MSSSPQNIAVLGSGSWATAIVKILSDNEQSKSIHWYIRKPETAQFISAHLHNPNYLSSVEIHPGKVKLHTHIGETIQSADIIILVIPSAFLPDVFSQIKAADLKGKKFVSAVKGLYPDTQQILGTFMKDRYDMAFNDFAVITGPCHAEEVALERLSYLTIASESDELRNTISDLLRNRYIRTVKSEDIYGTEYAAVLKNVYSIVSGICHGMGFGDNFQAVLISNAIREMKLFLASVYPIKRDINDSAYLGDLLVTCYSQFSRNRQFGNMLGKGYSVQSAQLEMNMIAEGYFSTKAIHQLNEANGIDMPLLQFAWEVIYEKKAPIQCIGELLDRLN